MAPRWPSTNSQSHLIVVLKPAVDDAGVGFEGVGDREVGGVDRIELAGQKLQLLLGCLRLGEEGEHRLAAKGCPLAGGCGDNPLSENENVSVLGHSADFAHHQPILACRRLPCVKEQNPRAAGERSLGKLTPDGGCGLHVSRPTVTACQLIRRPIFQELIEVGRVGVKNDLVRGWGILQARFLPGEEVLPYLMAFERLPGGLAANAKGDDDETGQQSATCLPALMPRRWDRGIIELGWRATHGFAAGALASGEVAGRRQNNRKW